MWFMSNQWDAALRFWLHLSSKWSFLCWDYEQSWSWNSNTLATWWEELTHLKRPWCWERLKAGGEGDDRGWDGWMLSLTQWRWVWVNSGSSWWTGRPGVLWSMGSRRVRHNWTTELNWTVSRVGEKKFWWTSNDILSVSTSNCVWSPQTVQLQKPVDSNSLS